MKCEKCKKEVKKGANFCAYCGNKINMTEIIFKKILGFILLAYGVLLWFGGISHMIQK